jgi:hypothetical protein
MVKKVFEEDNISVPMIMAKTVINKFFGIYRELKNPAKHLNAYVLRSALDGKKIKYLEDGKKKPAKVVEIDKESLGLRIETKDGSSLLVNSPSMVIIPNKI